MKLPIHKPCWDKETRTGRFRKVELMAYSQRFRISDPGHPKYDGKWSEKPYYVQPERGTVVLACENCGMVRLLKQPRSSLIIKGSERNDIIYD